jgi:predicted P-loop ATPase
MAAHEDNYFDILREAGVLDDDDELISEEDLALARIAARAKKLALKEKKEGTKKSSSKGVKVANTKKAVEAVASPKLTKKKLIKEKKKKKLDSYSDPKWEQRFVRKPARKDQIRGDILSNAHNAALIFSCDPRWKGVLAYDELLGDIVTLKSAPWHSDVAPRNVALGEWTDADTARAGIWITREYSFSVGVGDLRAALQITAERHSFHPVRRWLRALEWDGRPRLDDWLIRLCGAKDTPYVRAVSKNFLIGAVARAMEPGCQVDSMPIFEGEQGIFKSSMLRALGGSWFLETSIHVGRDKDSYQVLKGKWIVEWGEMGSMSRSEVNEVKQYISERVSTYRPSFGNRVRDFPRQCVFAGTTNPTGSGYLKDSTGARRFWPVALTRLDLEALKEERKQLFAEAYARYLQKEEYYFKDAALVKEHAKEAEKRRQKDPWEEVLANWLTTVLPKYREEGFTTIEILAGPLNIEPARMTRADSMKVAEILKLLGWDVVKRPNAYDRRYCPKNDLVTPFVPVERREKKRPKTRGFGDPSSGTFKKPALSKGEAKTPEEGAPGIAMATLATSKPGSTAAKRSFLRVVPTGSPPSEGSKRSPETPKKTPPKG